RAGPVVSGPAHLHDGYLFGRVVVMRQIMEQNNDAAKQVAIMEMGWTTDNRASSPYAWHAVTAEQQGDYLVKAIQYARQNWSSWVGPMVVLYIPDPEWTPNDEQYYW